MKKTTWIIIITVIVAICILVFFAMNNSSKSGSGVASSLKSLFPYGTSDYTNPGSTSTTNSLGVNVDNTGGDTTGSSYDPLIQLSQRSAVGMTVITPTYYAPTSSSTNNLGTASIPYQSTIFVKTKLPVLRFAERGTGYIYDVDARAQNETKQTGTTIVRAYESYFGDNGNSVIYRYLKNDNTTIATFLGKIVPPADSTSGQYATVQGDFLPENISDLVMAPNGKSFAYLLPTTNGVAGISLNTDETNKTQLFSSSFDEWLLDWKAGGLVATTKAASNVTGFAYLIQNTGVFQKIIGGVDGMTTNLSPDGKTLLYNSADGSTVNLYVRHQNGDSTKLDIATLPEKCVWAPDSIKLYCAVPVYLSSLQTYPDDWYQGTAHFTDGIWRIDTSLGTVTQVSDLESKAIDAVDLQLDPSQNFLFFRNNDDGTPWSLDLKKVAAANTVPTLAPFPAVGGSTNQ